MNILGHLSEPMKQTADGGAALIAIGTLAQILPSIAALLTILWLAIRIWESDTVRAMTKRPLKGQYRD
jgi:type IV secretory pathway TrbL component